MRNRRALATLAVAVLVSGSSAAASAASPDGPDSKGPTIVVGGQMLGPEQGLTITEETYLEAPGGDPVGYNPPAPAGTVSPMWVEGSSFAYSTEVLKYEYVRRGRAGGNISNGQRIVRVCFWWTQDQRKSQTYCGDAAYSDGRYTPGAEFVGGFTDTVNPNAPSTYFHVQVSRIDPNV